MTGGGPAHGPELTATAAAGDSPQSAGVAGSVASTGAPIIEGTPSFWAKLSKSSPLVALILQRLALSVALLFAVSLMIFGGVEALPGDFATVPPSLARAGRVLGVYGIGFVSRGDGDGAATRPQVEYRRGVALGQGVEMAQGEFHQQFGFGAWNEHIGRDLEH